MIIGMLLESASIGSETEEERRGSDAPRPPRRTPLEHFTGDTVKCRYNKCGKVASLAEARKTFKTCHNCTHVYCSRECRRSHWEKHRKTCLHSRVGALCRKVLSYIKEDDESLYQVSLMARRGFLGRGRGAVKVFFSSTEIAELFLNEGASRLGDPTFIRWADLSSEESTPEMHEELLRLCKSYNADSRLVLLVSVCVVSEVPTTGAVKWERQIVSRCAKIRMSKRLAPQRAEPSETPDTLILTSLPNNTDSSKKSRQISFSNIQRNLRQHGVSLRKQFPDLYTKLCDYVEGTNETFTPVTIYPQDSASGKTFMCIIMPDAEPQQLDFIPKDTNSVTKTIDISIDPDAENKVSAPNSN